MMDIQLIPTDELLNEIARRYDDVIFSARRSLTNNGKVERYRYQSGDIEVCIALCEYIKTILLDETEKEWNNGKEL